MNNKSNDGIMNPDTPHSVQEPIAARTLPDNAPSKARIRWPRANQRASWSQLEQELSATLTTRLKGSTATQLCSLCEIVHQVCAEKFGEEDRKKEKRKPTKQPNRRQEKKGQLRRQQRQLKQQLKDAPDNEKAGLQNLLDDIKQKILVISRAENHRKRRKRK